jgi:hypothetical protein
VSLNYSLYTFFFSFLTLPISYFLRWRCSCYLQVLHAGYGRQE